MRSGPPPWGVAFIVPELKIGGAERQLLHLVRALDRRRFRPVVIVLRAGGPLTPEFAASGVEVVEVGYRGRGDAFVAARISRALKSRAVRVACPFLWPATLWGYAGLKLAGIRGWVASERSSAAAYDPRWQVALENRILAGAPALVAISDAARAFALARGVRPARIHVVRIGVPEPEVRADRASVRATLRLDARAPVACCLARLAPEKDHATLLRAAALMLARVPEARVVIAGEGPTRAAVEAERDALGLSDRVLLLGARRDPLELLNACDVAVLASRDKEGCSNFLVEAALLGKPVVATRVGGIPEVVESGVSGVLVPPGEAGALADALAGVLADPTVGHRMGERGAAHARARFGLAEMVAQWQAILAQAAAR